MECRCQPLWAEVSGRTQTAGVHVTTESQYQKACDQQAWEEMWVLSFAMQAKEQLTNAYQNLEVSDCRDHWLNVAEFWTERYLNHLKQLEGFTK